MLDCVLYEEGMLGLKVVIMDREKGIYKIVRRNNIIIFYYIMAVFFKYFISIS